ncbi:MAG: acetyl-CoA acetyltransferase, partial [Kofleriaceae bacterium]
IHVGNAFGQLFTGQGQLGAMAATVRPALAGVPAARHEAACASGSIAVLAAMAELDAGRYGIALVLGVEQERNVPGDQCARYLGAAAWAGHEGQDAKYLWPSMFSRIGDVYAERFGLDRAHLVAISKKNLTNARRNPRAQTRGWTIDDAALSADDTLNPLIEGRLRRYDCGQVTDGGAAIILASTAAAEAWAQRTGRSLDSLARITGWGHTTAGLPLEPKLAASAGGGLVFPHVAKAAADARRRAGVPLEQLAGLETHDCFTTTEYMAIDHVGLTAPGRSFEAIDDGRTEFGGAFPINPSGGLIGVGHPVGATGVRMALDAALQVTDRAGDYQVSGARTFATLNLGGSATTVVSLVLAR